MFGTKVTRDGICPQRLEFSIKTHNEQIKTLKIEKQNIFYINPYIVIVTNNSLMTIISTLELNKHYVLNLPNSKTLYYLTLTML